jgi:3-hydroxyacyl-CoA dehydrogenase
MPRFIAQGWEKRFPNNPQYKVPKVLRKLVSEGKLGRKSGEGFYKYNK